MTVKMERSKVPEEIDGITRAGHKSEAGVRLLPLVPCGCSSWTRGFVAVADCLAVFVLTLHFAHFVGS